MVSNNLTLKCLWFVSFYIVSSFALNQFCNSAILSCFLASLKRFNECDPEISNIQSSANSYGKTWVDFERSSINNKRSKGQRQVPWGIPETHGNLPELMKYFPERGHITAIFLKVPSHDNFSFTISLHLISIFMYAQRF